MFNKKFINIKKRCVDWSNNNITTTIIINILLNITYAGCTTILKNIMFNYLHDQAQCIFRTTKMTLL
jgi:hypothetical protein